MRAYRAGHSSDALGAWLHALKEYEGVEGTEIKRAECHHNMAAVFSRIGKYSEALDESDKAVTLYRKIPGTERQQAECWANAGVTLRLMGRWRDAVAEELRALDVLRKLPNTFEEQALCLVTIGVASNDAGKFEQAIAHFEAALRLLELADGSKAQQAGCSANIAVSLASMGLHQEAITRSERAIVLAQESGAEADQARCVVNIGNSLRHLGRHDEAFRQYEHALSLFQASEGHEREQAVCYANLAEILSDQGQWQNAIRRLRRATVMFEEIKGTENDLAACWVEIGHNLLRLGHANEAIEVFENLNFSWRTSWQMGLALAARGEPGDLARALQQLLLGVRRAEVERASVVAFEHRLGVFEEPSVVFANLVALLVRAVERDEMVENPGVASWSPSPSRGPALLYAAFHFAGQAKGRALEDLIREGSTQGSTADRLLVEEDKALSLRLSRLSALRGELTSSEASERKGLDEEIEMLQHRRNMIEVELKKTALGRYVAPEFRKPMEMAKELEPDRAVLQYSVGEEEGWLLILTRDGVTAHKLGADTPALPELLPRQEATPVQLVEAWKKRPDKVGLDGLVRFGPRPRRRPRQTRERAE